jgi:hypothetical protein
MPRGDAEFVAYLVDFAADIAKSFPGFNPDGTLKKALDKQKHKNFIYPLPNPTTVAFTPLRKGLNSLDPVKYYGLHSCLVHWDPQVHFNHCSIDIRCPLCGRKAHRKQRTDSIRRICGLQGTLYLVGHRYECRQCPGEYHLLPCCQ